MTDHSLVDTAGAVRGRARKAAEQARDEAADRAEWASATISELAGRTRRRAEELGDRAYDGGGRIGRRLVRVIDERPAAAVGTLLLGATLLCGLSYLLLHRR